MAKRYVRINFENKPSHSTPLSAGNLNKMDKGIDDIDTELEDKLSKTTDLINNDTTGGVDKVASAEVVKVHGQEIDTINNNLATTVIDISSLIIIANDNFIVERALASKTGKTVTVNLILSRSSPLNNSDSSGVVLPVGYRPSMQFYAPCLLHDAVAYPTWGAKNIGLCHMGSSGGLLVRDYNDASCRVATIFLTYVAV